MSEYGPSASTSAPHSVGGGRPTTARGAVVDTDGLGGGVTTLAGMVAWIAVHIEQGCVLQDDGLEFGVVDAMAGYVHADLHLTARADHAGATPMRVRHDAGAAAAVRVVELERLALAAADGTAAARSSCRTNALVGERAGGTYLSRTGPASRESD
jgi:acetylornithine deacetylase/succinyl-diaminopimelate desuccinylase-like protein